MRDRAFTDFMVGALACISVLGFCAMVKETELNRNERRLHAAQRWVLPRRRRRRRSPEDDCRHCAGSGACHDCEPAPCRICAGTGLQPRDAVTVKRLTAIWDGAR